MLPGSDPSCSDQEPAVEKKFANWSSLILMNQEGTCTGVRAMAMCNMEWRTGLEERANIDNKHRKQTE